MKKAVDQNAVNDSRKGVDFIGVAIRWILHDGKGKVLLMQRGPKARDEQGAWEFGGGSVELNEKLEDAIARELYEELRSKPLAMEPLKMYDVHRINADGVPTHWINLLYAVQVDTSKIEIGEPDKISQVGWFNIKNLPAPLHTQFHKSLAIAQDKKLIT